jgi:hypothetical protein
MGAILPRFGFIYRNIKLLIERNRFHRANLLKHHCFLPVAGALFQPILHRQLKTFQHEFAINMLYTQQYDNLPGDSTRQLKLTTYT